MKCLLILLISSLSLVHLYAQKTIINDPNAVVREVKGYHAIEVSDAVELYLSQGDQETVAVSAREIKWRDRIRTEVVDGVLVISVDKKGLSWNTGNKKMKAYVSFTTLDKLKATGASDIYVDGVITGGSLDLDLSGASDFKGAVRVSALRVDQSGASDVHITGMVAGLTTVHSSGASDLKGYDLVTDSCEAHASGASDIRISVNKNIHASASGASSIYYKGDASVSDLRSSGASTVSKKG